jgi:hypothetical protein
MNLILLFALISSADDSPATPALDLEFAAAVEASVAGDYSRTGEKYSRIPAEYSRLIDRLDSDRYADRARAGAKLAAFIAADPSAVRSLLRARAVERRPEARYWLNRILRAANRCERCDGLGYCATYRPGGLDAQAFPGVPCRRCGEPEYRHGSVWVDGEQRDHLDCAACGGSGTYWNHWAVD